MSAAPAYVILASASPRRSALLHQIGVPHRVVAPGLEERRAPGESVAACVRRLACAKAQQVWERTARAAPMPDALPVLGADTAVVLDDEMLGKPQDRAAALAMLARLSGRSHRVLSAVALRSAGGLAVRLSASEVQMRALGARECDAYWESGEPRDKAGSYAIQGYAAVFIAALRGSYSGVMGLPLFETAALLAEAGVPCWQVGPSGA